MSRVACLCGAVQLGTSTVLRVLSLRTLPKLLVMQLQGRPACFDWCVSSGSMTGLGTP